MAVDVSIFILLRYLVSYSSPYFSTFGGSLCSGRIESSLSGKYLVLVMETGEVNIYGSSQLILGGQQTMLVSEAQHKSSRASHKLIQSRSVKEVSRLASEEVVLGMLRHLQKF